MQHAWPYAIALGAVSGATLATWLVWPHGQHAPFTLYYVAVLIVALYGNGTASALCIAAATAIVDVWLLPESASGLDAERLISVGLFVLASGLMAVVVRREAARRLAHPRELERMSRLYSALSQVNQAIVWMPTKDLLFRKVCEALVHEGGFSMAWVAWHDPESQRLAPIASVGDDAGYVDGVRIYADDRAEGHGPSGRAFREDQPYICNDVLTDSTTLPWRKALALSGFRSSAAIPIHRDGSPCGLLNVYHHERGFFRSKEIALLKEAAVDVSFALDNLAKRAEHDRMEALVATEQRFATNLIEALPGILYLYDEQGKFLRWNQNFEVVSGYSASEIEAMHPLDFFAGAEKELLRERIDAVFQHGSSEVEAHFVAKDGTRTPYFLNGKHISFDGLSCLVGIGIDVSERKQAELALSESAQRFRSTLDSILEGCQLIGFDWRYLYLNDAAATHNRRPNSEILGRTMQECWPGIEASDVFRMLERCLTERMALHEETEFIFPDGSSGWFDVRAQPVPEGVFVLSIDISERKRAEFALRELNASLELRVAERTAELSAASERAEAADRLKSAFLATMSHELRTPLNSIIGFTGILLQGLAGPLNAEQSKQLGMVQTSARHLLELINDVLDISKIEAGQLELQAAPFNLRESVERVTSLVAPLAEKKGLSIHVVAPSVRLVSDRRRVDQILLNLVNNALKFTDPGGSVTLSATEVALPGAGGEPAVHIEIADTGIGMKAEDLELLFQPFRQLDSGLGRKHEGTGLGLAICRRLTGLLGGSIDARSEWGKGSVFSVTLPLKAPGGAA